MPDQELRLDQESRKMVIDRKATAVVLRIYGVSVDFEEWDGMDDDYVRSVVIVKASNNGLDSGAVFRYMEEEAEDEV